MIVVPLLVVGMLWLLIVGIPLFIVEAIVSTLLGDGILQSLIEFLLIFLVFGVYPGACAFVYTAVVAVIPEEMPTTTGGTVWVFGLPVALVALLAYWMASGTTIDTLREFLLMFTTLLLAGILISNRSRWVVGRARGHSEAAEFTFTSFLTGFILVCGTMEAVMFFFDLPGYVGVGTVDWSGLLSVYLLPMLLVAYLLELAGYTEPSGETELAEFATESELFFAANSGEGMFTALTIAFVVVPTLLLTLEASVYGTVRASRLYRTESLSIGGHLRKSAGAALVHLKRGNPLSALSRRIPERSKETSSNHETKTVNQPDVSTGSSRTSVTPEDLVSSGTEPSTFHRTVARAANQVGLKEVGNQGGTGPLHVVSGRDAQSGSTVQVLTPSPTLSRDDFETAFLDILQSWHQVSSHPHTARLLDYDTEPWPWAVREVKSDWELFEDTHLSLTRTDRLTVLGDVSKTLQALHRYNRHHLHLEPSSVAVPSGSEQSTGYIAGWGIEKPLVEAHPRKSDTSKFAAPEQVESERFGPVGSHTDIYRLGAVAYWALTGRPPGSQTDGGSSSDHIEQPTALNSALPAAADTVLTKALAVEPENRYESLYVLSVELDQLKDDL